MATTADSALVTALLKAFFSHEGRVVAHLEQNVQAILADPGRGFFTLGGDKGVATTTIRISAGGGASAEIEEIWVQPSARAWAGACCARPSPSAGAAASSRSNCASRPTTRSWASPTSIPSRASATAAG